jgi:hypothetical protein
LVVQVVASLLGGDSDADAPEGGDLHGDVGDAQGAVSFRTVVAFLTFFGIGGMAADSAGLGPLASALIAIGCGSIAFWLMALALAQLHRLRSAGNVDIRNAVGAEGKVYLPIPAERAGSGRVTVPIQGRTAQFLAITRGQRLETGQLCRVVGVHAGDTLEVEAL